MKLIYFDCFAGAAGDMILGALLDAGLPLDELKRALGSLGVDGWDVSADRVTRCGVSATKFRVHEHAPAMAGGAAPDGAPAAHRHYHLGTIKKRIDQSALSVAGKARAHALFDRLASVESRIHGTPVERVHLHEVGALDSIIDIVGAVFALEWFGADRVVVSPINVGGGMVKTAHGMYPVPAPATAALLESAPVYGSGVQAELLTPTGALLLTDYATSFGPMPAMRLERVGYGAGDRELPETPNVLRVLVGRSADEAGLARVVVVECDIDDMNPQIFGALMETLHEAGALDVYYVPAQMKKNRPGTLMTIVAHPADRERLVDLVFRETTTIGVRWTEMLRECLERETVVVPTPLGDVRFKIARRDGEILNAQAEFEDLVRLAAEGGRSIKEVQSVALKAWLER
ncbi:MAG: nickel pincer cofactor biosynthesis protein LarC [Acidobacteriota bacterium]